MTRIALITRDKDWLKSKKKKPKTERMRLRDQLDDLWRILIKEMYGNPDGNYYYCEKCGKACESGEGAGRGKGINAHHIIGKSNWNVRWDLENGSPLDSGCHTMKKDSAHQDRSAFLKKIIEKRGQEWYDRLCERAGKEGGSKKWTLEAMKAKKREFRELIKSIEED